MDNETAFNETKYKNEFNRNNYDRLSVVTAKGNKAIIQEHCKKNNISLNKLIDTLLKDYFKSHDINLK